MGYCSRKLSTSIVNFFDTISYMPTSNQTYDVIIKKYAPNEIIVSEDTAQDFFYVILEGSVQITRNRKIIRILDEDDVFGAENHNPERPYTTTASAITASRIAAYRSENIHNIFYTNPLMAEQIFASAIRQLVQTTDIAEKNIPLEITNPIREQVYRDGEIIITEGTEGCEIFRLIEAQHGLSITLQGREIGTITSPGEFFGEMSTLLHKPHSETVTSIGRTRVQVFTVANLEENLSNYPDLAMAIINSMSNQLREAKHRLADTAITIPGSNNEPGSTT
jgi:CRP/FNR family cyclic AMP-dependent transcriptional regulator